MADQPSKPRTIPQLKRSLVLAHAAYQRSLTDAGYMHQVRAKKRIRDAEEALAQAEQQAQAAQGHRLTSDQALARLAEPELKQPEQEAEPEPEPCDFCGGQGVPPDEDGNTKCPVCGAGMDPAARKRPTPAEEPWLCPDSVEQDALADQEAEEAAFTVVFATRADLLHALGDPADPGTDEGLEALAHQVWAGADFDVAGGR